MSLPHQFITARSRPPKSGGISLAAARPRPPAALAPPAAAPGDAPLPVGCSTLLPVLGERPVPDGGCSTPRRLGEASPPNGCSIPNIRGATVGGARRSGTDAAVAADVNNALLVLGLAAARARKLLPPLLPPLPPPGMLPSLVYAYATSSARDAMKAAIAEGDDSCCCCCCCCEFAAPDVAIVARSLVLRGACCGAAAAW